MKKIVKNLEYDTDNDTLICINYEYNREDALYQTLYGDFYLWTEVHSVLGSSIDEIIPYTENEAKDFVAHYGTIEEYETLFEPVED